MWNQNRKLTVICHFVFWRRVMRGQMTQLQFITILIQENKDQQRGRLYWNSPDVFLVGLALPGVDGDSTSCHGRGGVVLGGEDVAAGPGHFGAQLNQGLHKNGRLDGHVKTSCDAGAWMTTTTLQFIPIRSYHLSRDYDTTPSPEPTFKQIFAYSLRVKQLLWLYGP